MLRAYRVEHILVYADRGTEAKILAAPKLKPMEEWQKDVAAWVALRAERAPEMDAKVDMNAVTPYIAE